MSISMLGADSRWALYLAPCALGLCGVRDHHIMSPVGAVDCPQAGRVGDFGERGFLGPDDVTPAGGTVEAAQAQHQRRIVTTGRRALHKEEEGRERAEGMRKQVLTYTPVFVHD